MIFFGLKSPTHEIRKAFVKNISYGKLDFFNVPMGEISVLNWPIFEIRCPTRQTPKSDSYVQINFTLRPFRKVEF